MDLAIEYVLRQNRAERLLNLPCSLFLENAKEKIVVALIADGNNVKVRRYFLSQNETSLPTYKETVISLAYIFIHPDVIIPDYKLLEFQSQPYTSQENQVNDLPLAAIQEKQYTDCLKFFLSPKKMNNLRENWLWASFNSKYVTKEIKDKFEKEHIASYNNMIPEFQRDYLKKSSYNLDVWKIWKDNMLIESNPASELVFAKYYVKPTIKFMKTKRKKKKNDEIDDMLKQILEMRNIYIQ